MSEDLILRNLNEKYQKEFLVNSYIKISDTGMFDYRLSPKDKPELEFKVDFNPKTENINDYYPYALWQYQADQWVRSILDEVGELYVLKTGVSVDTEYQDLSIPSYESIIEESPEEVSLNIFLHLFGKMNEETLETQIELDAKLAEYDFKKVGFTISIYDITALGGGGIADQNFDFGVHSEGTFESENTEHFLSLIKYRIKADRERELTVEDLESIAVDNPNSMMFKKL